MFLSLSRRLGLEPRELRKALWLGGVLMAVTGSYTLVKTARDSLFLSLLPATWLPWVYLVVGFVTLAVSIVAERLTQRLTPLRALVTTVTGATLGLIVFAVILNGQEWWLPAGFYLYVNAYGLIVVSQFWLYTNSTSDPREMKRICGIVGGGAILGGLVGGFVAAMFAARLPLPWLVSAGAALLALSGPMLARIRRQADPHADGDPVSSMNEEPVPLTRVPYVRWLALASLCSVIVTGLLDYQLKIVVQQMYPTGPQLASFFGRFYLGMNIIALVVQLIGTRALLQWLGAGSAAALLPLGLAAGAGATIVSPGLATVLGTRLWDQVVRFSVNKSAVELLFFPLAPGLKRRAKAVIGAGIERVGDALAGILILVAGLLLDTTPATLAALVIALVAPWLIASLRLRSGYVRELGRNLGRMTLEPEREPVSLRERGILRETVHLLESPYERVVLQAIDLLEANAPRLLDPRIPKLLTHPASRVRARALERVASSPSPVDRQSVTALVHDRDPIVRLMALRARCTADGTRSLAPLDEYLAADDQEVRATAIACLVEQATEEEWPAVRTRIARYLSDGGTEDRAAVAAALGGRPGSSGLDEVLTPLLTDADTRVRCAALRAAGCGGRLEYVPVLVDALAERETEVAARDALLAFGDRVVAPLGDALIDARVPLAARRVIPRVLGGLPTPDAVAALFAARDPRDVVLSYRILKAANHLRWADQALVFPVDSIEQDLDGDIREFLLAELHADTQSRTSDLEPASAAAVKRAGQFLALVLRERMAQAFNRVFRRLALLHPPGPILSAYVGTLSTHARVRANAGEYIERVLSPELRASVLPLLPGVRREQRLELAEQRYGLRPLTSVESLEALLDGDDLWLRSCALYVVGVRRQRDLMTRVESHLASGDARVRETALWVKAVVATG